MKHNPQAGGNSRQGVPEAADCGGIGRWEEEEEEGEGGGRWSSNRVEGVGSVVGHTVGGNECRFFSCCCSMRCPFQWLPKKKRTRRRDWYRAKGEEAKMQRLIIVLSVSVSHTHPPSAIIAAIIMRLKKVK